MNLPKVFDIINSDPLFPKLKAYSFANNAQKTGHYQYKLTTNFAHQRKYTRLHYKFLLMDSFYLISSLIISHSLFSKGGDSNMRTKTAYVVKGKILI